MSVSFGLRIGFARHSVVKAVFVSLCALVTGISNAATLYVSTTGKDTSANPSNINTPLYSLQKAVDRARPGDIIKMRGGTYKYTEGTYIGVLGTAAAHITIQSYGNEWAILDGSRMSATAHAEILTLGGAYVDLKSLEVKNSFGAGIVIWNGNNNTISNCDIDNNQRQAIYLGADDVEVTSLKNFNNRIDSCELYNNVKENIGTTANGGWDSAITMNNHHNTVVNCLVYNNWGEGIGCYGRYNYVGYNQVHDNFSVNIYLDNAQNDTVENNSIIGQNVTAYYRDGRAAAGIQIANEGNGNNLNNCVVRNNTIQNVWRGLYYWNAYAAPTGMKNMDIYGNIISSCADAVVLIEDDNHSNAKIRNNTFIRNDSTVVYIPSNVSNTNNIYR